MLFWEISDPEGSFFGATVHARFLAPRRDLAKQNLGNVEDRGISGDVEWARSAGTGALHHVEVDHGGLMAAATGICDLRSAIGDPAVMGRALAGRWRGFGIWFLAAKGRKETQQGDSGKAEFKSALGVLRDLAF